MDSANTRTIIEVDEGENETTEIRVNICGLSGEQLTNFLILLARYSQELTGEGADIVSWYYFKILPGADSI
jgi:hypothetical protein